MPQKGKQKTSKTSIYNLNYFSKTKKTNYGNNLDQASHSYYYCPYVTKWSCNRESAVYSHEHKSFAEFLVVVMQS